MDSKKRRSGLARRRKNRLETAQLEIDFMPPKNNNNSTPQRPNEPLGSMEQTGTLLVKHESEIASLRTQTDQIQNQLQETKTQMARVELSVQALGQSMNQQLDKIVDKMNAKNPMFPIALGGLTLTLITVASSIILYTINSSIKPIQEKAVNQDERLRSMDDRQRKMGEDLLRIDERSKWSNLKKATISNASDSTPNVPANPYEQGDYPK